MAFQPSSVSGQKPCIHPCCLSLTHIQTSSHDQFFPLYGYHPGPDYHPIFPGLLQWPPVLSLSFCIAPQQSLLHTRGHSHCLKALHYACLCQECPSGFPSLLEKNQGPYSGLEASYNLICDFFMLWVLLPLSYLTLLWPHWPHFCALKCQVHSDLRAYSVTMPGTLFPKVPT